MFRFTSEAFGLFAIALFLRPASSLVPGTARWTPAVAATSTILRRAQEEHVVLADCRDQKGVISSQMAYYPGSPGPKPQDVAVVVTKPGEAALWVNTVTEGLFTSTGVVFRSELGPKVADGQYAGTGHNGYGAFTCWQQYVSNLYTYDNTTCSAVYYCNHEPAPAVLPTPVANQTAQPSGSATSSAPGAAASGSQGGLSQAALIGIVVGIGGTLAVAAALGLFLWTWRRTRPGEAEPKTKGDRSCCGLFTRRRRQHHEQPRPATLVEAGEDTMSKPTGKMYEVDGQWFRAEMAQDHGKFELEGDGTVETDRKWRPTPESEYPLVKLKTEMVEAYSEAVLSEKM